MLAAMRAASWMASEPFLESGDLRAERSARSGTKKSDHRHRRLLRPRRKRPRRRRAEERDELAPPHSITSSARASRIGGTSMPSAFAVLRLMTSSYLVGACTGRSAGFSPLRMRVYVAGRSPVLVDKIGPIGDQAASSDVVALGVNRWQLVPGRERDDQIAMNRRQRTRRYDQAAIRLARVGHDGALDLGRVTHVDRAHHLHADRQRHVLDDGELADPGG